MDPALSLQDLTTMRPLGLPEEAAEEVGAVVAEAPVPPEEVVEQEEAVVRSPTQALLPLLGQRR